MKIGIVGCGYWGAKHLRSLHELGGCELIACDSNSALLTNVERRYPGISTTPHFPDLLDSDVQGIILATPMGTHFRLAREALLRGKDVLVEKPLTTDLAQAEDLVELAEQRQAVLMVGHTFLYNPAVDAVRELILAGELGDLYYLDFARLNLGLFQQDASVLWDLAPHDLSILLYWMDQSPTELCARGGAHVNRRVHDNVHLDLRFAEGAEAHVHLSWLEPSKVRRSTVVGTRKMVVYDDVAPAEKVWIYDRGVHVQYHTDNFDDFHLSYRYGNTTILHTPGDEPLQLEQKHFIGCIRERRRPKSDGFNGLRVVALMEDAQHSLAAGGVTVPVRPLVVDPPPELGSGLGPITQARAGRTARSNGIARDLVGERS